MHKVIVLVLIGTMVLTACAAPAGSEQAAAAGSAAAAEPASEQQVTSVKNCYVPNQVLITGYRDVVETFISERGLDLQPIEGKEFPLSYFANFLGRIDSEQKPQLLPSYPMDPTEGYSNLVTRLYSTDNVELVLTVINQESNNLSSPIFVDPNYVIGQPELSQSELISEYVGGSGWHAFGSPAGGKPTAANGGFEQQWAFSQIALSAKDELDLSGAGVWVGVFDVFPDPQLPAVNLDIPEALLDDVSDHGSFVVGLVQGVAPGATIKEYPVLNQYGYGTLDHLVSNLDKFLQEVAQDSDIPGAVVNLSLGVHWCPDFVHDESIDALSERLVGAYNSNVPTIAAAGNGSLGDSNRRQADIPAVWDGVLGVAASDQDGNYACYSNQGNVLAPGGKGNEHCQPAWDQCSDPNCAYGLISTVTSKPGYAYWAGTSFATPLTSGLAALFLQQQREVFNAVFNAGNGSITETVYHAIWCSQYANYPDDLSTQASVNARRLLAPNCLHLQGTLIPHFELVDNVCQTMLADPLSESPAIIKEIGYTSQYPLSKVDLELIHVETEAIYTLNAHPNEPLVPTDVQVVTGTWQVKADGYALSLCPTITIVWEQQR